MAASSSISERIVAFGSHRVACLEAGAGVPLVLLHGIGSAARSWRGQLEELSDAYRVLAWDAPGYGASTPVEGGRPTTDAYVDILDGFLDALKIERFHLAGHSLGSLIAARFAARHSGKLLSLTLASCAVGHARLADEERRRLLEGRLGDVETLGMRGMADKRGPRLLGPQADEASIRAVIEVMGSAHPAGYAQAANMLSQGDMFADLISLPASLPVLVVWGSADVITPPPINRKVADALPQAQVDEIPTAGHALYVEKAAQFNAVLRRFIGAHAG